MEYDVIVVGGGFAGVGAAIAAARENKKVLLIEKDGALGGAANSSLVLPYMSYATTIKDENGNIKNLVLVKGIFKIINDRLQEQNKNIEKKECIRSFDTEYLKLTLNRLMIEYGVTVLFHTTVCGVYTYKNKINSVEAITVGGKMVFSAKCFIDASGDGNLSFLSGCDYIKGRKQDSLCQPMTLCFRVINVDYNEVAKINNEIQELYTKYHNQNKFINPRENVLYFKPVGENCIHFNSTRIVKLDPCDPFDISKAEMQGHEQMYELFHFLKENFECFKNAEIFSSGASIGVRESRMILCEHFLKADEILNLTKFDDAVTACNYDIDIHNPEGSGTSHRFFNPGEYYTIPYRSMVVSKFENLLVAGRCISCDHEVQASLRIMPTCCAMGEACGVASSLMIDENTSCKNININELQKILKQNNVFF